MNAEQASKPITREPTRPTCGEGWHHDCVEADSVKGGLERQWPRDPAGVLGDGMSAQGERTQHGKPLAVGACNSQPDAREGQAGPTGVADRLVVAMKPVNTGGAKGPEFKTDVRRGTRTRRLA